MTVADTVAEAARDLTNAQGRSTRHVLLGLAITVGAVAASALIATRNSPTPSNPEVKGQYDRLEKPALQPPRAAFSMIWPPLFLVLTLSGLRIWNAPRSPARTQALTLWGGVQALNAVWMALGPKRLGGQLTAAVASLGTAAAYAWRARRVDAPAANMVAPYLGWISFANVLTEELWRKNAPRPTLH